MIFNLLPILLALLLVQCRNKEEGDGDLFASTTQIPAIIQQEHDALIQKLSSYTQGNDTAANAAKKLRYLVVHHFSEEEEFILPVLGALPLLSEGKQPDEPEKFLRLTRWFSENALHIDAEHQMIRAYLDEFIAAALPSDPSVLSFQRELHQHAKVEEELYFPMVKLIGEHIKLQREKKK